MVDGQQGRLGAVVRDFRRRAGLIQQELADLAGLSVAGLRDIEQGRVSRPRASTLRRLGNVLQLSRVELADLMREASGDQTSGLRVEILGPLRVSVAGETVDLGSETQRVLLGVLALSPNLPVMRDTLSETVWGGRSGTTRVDSLQSRLSRLRHRLQAGQADSADSGVLVAVRGGYQLTVAEGQHDLLTYRRLVAQARDARSEDEPNDACRFFAEAVALWRGDPLEGLPTLQSHPAVVALVREHRAVVVEYAEVACDVGRYHDVLPLLRHAAEADPLHEAIHGELMLALAGSGQQAAALNVFHTLRRRLADELGADPRPELTAAYQRVLRQEVARPEFAPVTAHRQLPPDIADFAGRDAQLRELDDGLRIPDGGTSVAVSLIEGMGGVGKTRLAVHLAHRLLAAGRYTDAQLYVDLRGHADQPPADPSAVLMSFLRLLGVPGEQIPPGLDERASLYRDRLFGTNALVLLDNAAGEDQVLPLLPAGPGNLVLITSRRALALDGARTLPLEAFTSAEARELLAQVVGGKRVEAEQEAAQRVVDLCGRLPLAVALTARRLLSRASWTIADLAERLQEAGDRLSELASGSRRLRAVFDLSYQALDADEKRMFRLLGLHPGDDFTADSAAALAGLTLARARGLLDRLVDENLAMVMTRQRYRLHDLLAEYARVLVRDEETGQSRHEAITRVLDFYLHTAARATYLVQPHQWTMTLAGAEPAHHPELADREQARRWLYAERACLIDAGRVAADQGRSAHAWQLTRTLREYLDLHGHDQDQDWVRARETALAAASASGDPVGVALAHDDLAKAYMDRGRVKDAREHLQRALEFHRDAGDRSLQASTLEALGVLYFHLGEFPEAMRHGQEALALCAGHDRYREGSLQSKIGNLLVILDKFDDAMDAYRRGLAVSHECGDPDMGCRSLAGIGEVHRRLGRYPEAIDALTRALTLAGENDLIPRMASPRQRLGNVYRELGRFDDALANFSEALRILRTKGGPPLEGEVLIDFGAAYREIGNLSRAYELIDHGLRLAIGRSARYHEARALYELAELHRCAGRSELAQDHWRRAHALFEELGTPEADQIREFPGSARDGAVA